MNADKEFVLAHWDGARFESVFENSQAWLHKTQVELPRNRGRILCDRTNGGVWILSGNANTPFEISKALPEEAAWAAAAEFTRNRLEEIRQVEEEMMLLRSMVILLDSEPGDLTAPIYKRTIARLQAALAELKRGMK